MISFNKAKGKRTGIIFITVGVTALICLLLFYFFGNKLFLNQEREFEPNQTLGAVEESISIPGFDSMKIPQGTTLVSTNLYNPDKNTCNFEISIILSSTKEEIYKSKLVSPGQHLYQVELSRVLEKGTYDAILHYNTFSLDENTPMNGANVPFKLVVE